MPTTTPDSYVLFGCLTAIQVLGLVSALLARMSHGCRRQGACQWMFFACLALVGMSAVIALSGARGWLLPSGTTLSLMILTTTWDFGRSSRETA